MSDGSRARCSVETSPFQTKRLAVSDERLGRFSERITERETTRPARDSINRRCFSRKCISPVALIESVRPNRIIYTFFPVEDGTVTVMQTTYVVVGARPHVVVLTSSGGFDGYVIVTATRRTAFYYYFAYETDVRGRFVREQRADVRGRTNRSSGK